MPNRRTLQEALALSDCCENQTIIMPGDGLPDVPAGIKIVTYRQHWRLARIIKCYYLAFKSRARIYHLHDPELLILGWCIRLFTNAAIIYDAHRPTFHYFLWKFNTDSLLARFKAGVLKIIEIIGVIFIDGLIVAAPRSLAGIGRFCRRKVWIGDYPGEITVSSDALPDSLPIIIYGGELSHPADVNCILQAFFQVRLELPQAVLVLTGHFSKDFLPILRVTIQDMLLEEAVILAGPAGWSAYADTAVIGLATPNENEYFQRGRQPEILEFLARGIPVICGRSPFTEELVAEGETGIVLPDLVPLRVSETILSLYRQPALRAEMGCNGRRLITAKYGRDELKEKICKFYHSLFPA
ncbi:MAG: glycosyltransferase [Candidatus Neomarinimicrobiota bacterium]